jgi:hypothetical protein
MPGPRRAGDADVLSEDDIGAEGGCARVEPTATS